MQAKSKIISGLLAFMMLFGNVPDSLSYSAWLELIGVLSFSLGYSHSKGKEGEVCWSFLLLVNSLFGLDIYYRFINRNSAQEKKEEIEKCKEKIEHYKSLYGSLDQYDENGKRIS